jgi:hypothetical protein
MIEYATRLAVHGGYYGSSKQYIDFIKIGAGIPRQVTKDLMRDFAAHMEEQFDITVTPGVSIATEDGYVFSFQVEEGGTNWNGFGFTVRKVETEGVTEAGRKQPSRPKFTAYPSYHAWRLELMRRGDDNIDHLDNDYVDNYRVLFAVDRNRRVVGMYYRTAETGTFVPPGQGFSDMIYYASADPHWPYSDDDGKEDLR